MSFVIKTIPMDLTAASIDNAIREVNLIRNRLHPAMMHLIEKLAEKGVEIARAELIFFSNPAYDTGALSESVAYRMNQDGATVSAGEGLESGYEGMSYALFVEYGTGIYGADINNHGMDGWWYPSPNGWWTPKQGKYRGQSMAWTVGMQGRPFMHNTLADLEEEVRASGGRIVAEYLAGDDGA